MRTVQLISGLAAPRAAPSPPTTNPPHGRRRPDRRAAYSVLELLVVMLVIAILLAMIFPAITALKRGMDRRRAHAESRALVNAALSYRNVYGQWPMQYDPTIADSDHYLVFGDPERSFESHFEPTPQGTLLDQAHLIAALSTNEILNPRAVRFIDFPDDRIESGRFVDPWGRPYVVALDQRGFGDTLLTVTGDRGSLRFSATNHPAAAASWGNPARPGQPVYSWIAP